MTRDRFEKLVYTPAGEEDVALAIAACRAGGVGVLNAELGFETGRLVAQLDALAARAKRDYGLRLQNLDLSLVPVLRTYSTRGLRWLILDADAVPGSESAVAALRAEGIKVFAETIHTTWTDRPLDDIVDGLVVKGNEAGGFVGESSSFIILQKWLGNTRLPLYIRGGVTPQVAAACDAVGVAGGVLDSQVLLLAESPFAAILAPLLEKLSGTETVAVGDAEKSRFFRVLMRPGHNAARDFSVAGEGKDVDILRELVRGKINWRTPERGLLPVGQDVCFAGPWRKKYRTVAGLFAAIDTAVADSLPIAARTAPMSENSPLARFLGTKFPIVQGPMTRVSDVPDFAKAVSDGGALPVQALALLKGQRLDDLLRDTAAALKDRSWAIGMLGFAPQSLLDEQLQLARRYHPRLAILAGGRPDQVAHVEAAGIETFLHVPAEKLVPLFLQDGTRRFIFEGRECGGHVGPLCSFVLWSSIISTLVDEIDSGSVPAAELRLLFAGGIHDAVSSAMVQVLAAPLLARGVQVGCLMGTAYLFTEEIVASGATVPGFQQQALACEQTVILESGPGHGSRCAQTPFAGSFLQKRKELIGDGVRKDETRKTLDDLILGRLRLATKGFARAGEKQELVVCDENQQLGAGMYMLGQLATLRHEKTNVATLHRNVTADAHAILESRLSERTHTEPELGRSRALPADVAIIGMSCLFPKANQLEEYWDNILGKVNAVTEIPRDRWDWRLYFDENRDAEDKIYSKWGGFIDPLAFDPASYGMPPKSVASVDPLQLMALEVARRAMVDAGYEQREFDRESASVIIGASGGAGDVGMQYGLRAELPRFQGDLSKDMAERLPQWTEDTFPGILINVVAGRIANRLNFGGTNFTVDAACAASLAAIYQGVNSLISGQSSIVIAGGVDTMQGPFGYLCFSKTQALSPRGRCSTFDKSADGIVISEGLGMVVLKRLADAERDGDRIYAVIKGIAGSSDGKARGLHAPLPAGQLRAMRRAYVQAGFGPETIDLFEAHGTGTVAGDTAELESTTTLIREAGGHARQAAVGSVKAFIGHTKATAGAAGMIKAVMALHHRVLPPHAECANPNDVLQSTECPLYLIGDARPWLSLPDRPRRAAVSAFGFGGSNFHAVLEEYQPEYGASPRTPAGRRWPAELLLWSAENRQALVERVDAIGRKLGETASIELRDLAFSLAREWRPGLETLAIVAADKDDLVKKLDTARSFLQNGGKLPAGVYVSEAADPAAKVAILFSGQGSQYPDMFRELAWRFGAFAGTLGQADEFLEERFATRFGPHRTLSSFIYPRGTYSETERVAAADALRSTDVAQPALGAVEAGLWALMQQFGLRADMFAGHSYGEFVALYAAGMMDLRALMELSESRGRLIVDAVKDAGGELGTMAAVSAARSDVEKTIAGIDGVTLANHNAPAQCVISGSVAGIKTAIEKLSAAGFEVNSVPVAAAFHSLCVAPALSAFRTVIEETPWREGVTPVYSNSTGEPHPAEPDGVRRAMTEHLVRQVEFVAEVEAMYRDGARIFVELGPKSVLARLVDRILGDRPHQSIGVDNGGIAGLLQAFARLICAGVELDVAELFAGRDCRVVEPANLHQHSRSAALTPQTWVLNGSVARRAQEPVRQVGIVKEDVKRAPIERANTPLYAAGPDAAAAAVPPAGKVKARARTEVGAGTPASGNDHVMSDYFATMRHFLETQERVMSLHLGAAHDSSRPVPRAATPVREIPVPKPVAAKPPVRAAAPAKAVPVAPQPVAAAMASAAVPAAPDGLDRANMTKILLNIIEEKTGYPPEMVGLQQNLEEEFSIDSIKRVEIVGALLKALPAAYAQALGQDRGKLNTQATLDGMLDLLQNLSLGRPATVASASAQPAVATVPVQSPANAAASASADALDRASMTKILLNIIEEKTGYPPEMVGLQQNLEEEFSIDSIKRVEIVGALLKALPAAYAQALGQDRGKLNTQATLDGMLDLLQNLQAGKAAAVAPAVTEVVLEATPSPSPGGSFRYLIESEVEAIDPRAAKRLAQGLYLVAGDTLGVTTELRTLLERIGCRVSLLEGELLEDQERLRQRCAALCAEEPRIAGIIHLAPLGAGWLHADSPSSIWRSHLERNEKSLFTMLSACAASLVDDAGILAGSALGGFFGRDGRTYSGLSLQGGAVGLLKSLRQERPQLRVKAVDVDPGQTPVEIASSLLAELELVGGRHEVGYPGGTRTIFRTVPAPAGDAAADVHRNMVVLATGGLRGITAELLRELALPGNTLLITGRTPLPGPEANDTRSLATAEELRRHFVTEVREGRAQMSPGKIEGRVQSILNAREMHANLDDFRKRGTTVEYFDVDVVDDASMARLFAEIERKYGALDGVIHGAGVIEDRLLEHKSSESWSRIVDTKVCGLLHLQKYVQPSALKFLMVLSSVAGRYGNSGQTDYATANELMNRLCCQLHSLWQGRVNVKALCWGPWGPTTFGAGMVTAETEAKFARNGVKLVEAEAGRRLLSAELRASANGHVEVICGEGPWEEREAANGRMEIEAGKLVTALGPLVTDAEVGALPTGEQIVTFVLNGNHTYLQDHRFDGTPVLPAAAALEIMAEAARQLWLGWKVVEVRDCRVLNGIKQNTPSSRLTLLINSGRYDSIDGFDVDISIQSDAGNGRPRIHYQSVVRLARELPEGFSREPRTHDEVAVSVTKAYGEWLSHGPRFQLIESIEGLSAAGARAVVKSTRPAEWVEGLPASAPGWVFDPGLVDAATQMAWLWCRAFLDETALPARFASVVQYTDVLPDRLIMDFERIATDDPHLVHANVYFLNPEGRVLLMIEGLESISSAELNRLGGSASGVASNM